MIFSFESLRFRSCRFAPLQAEKSKHEDHKAAWQKLAAQWQRLAQEVDPSSQQAQQPQTTKRP